MISKNHPIILFIDRNGFNVFQDTLTNIPRFAFTSDLVANLDVVNKEKFVNLIATFIQINKIIPSSLLVILSSNVTYTKDLANVVQKTIVDQELESKDGIQNFLENIPFEEVLARVIKVENINRVVAVNKDLVMTIISVFTSKTSTLETITPDFVCGQNANFTAGLSSDNARVILESINILKSCNLLTNQEAIVSSQESEKSESGVPSSNEAKKPQNFRQFMLIGILVALLIIFVVVYLNLGVSQVSPVRKVKKTTSIISAPTAVPTPVQIENIITPVDIKSVIIKIINAQSEAVADALKNQLTQVGFENIAIETSQELVAEKSSILFSQNISVDVKNIALAEIRKTFPNASVLENQDNDMTITILTGKP